MSVDWPDTFETVWRWRDQMEAVSDYRTPETPRHSMMWAASESGECIDAAIHNTGLYVRNNSERTVKKNVQAELADTALMLITALGPTGYLYIADQDYRPATSSLAIINLDVALAYYHIESDIADEREMWVECAATALLEIAHFLDDRFGPELLLCLQRITVKHAHGVYAPELGVVRERTEV